MQTYVGLLRLMYYALVSNYMIICLFFFLGPWLSAEHKIYQLQCRPKASISLEAHCSNRVSWPLPRPTV